MPSSPDNRGGRRKVPARAKDYTGRSKLKSAQPRKKTSVGKTTTASKSGTRTNARTTRRKRTR